MAVRAFAVRFLLGVALSVSLVSCGVKDAGPTPQQDAEDVDSTATDPPDDTNLPDESPEETTPEVDCGNDVGNGFDIVSGPQVTDPPIDNDSVFRSLVIDPRDANVVFCGSERNGFLKTIDGGVTWTRLREGLRHSVSPQNYPEVWNVAFSPADSNTVIAAMTDSAGPLTGDVPSAIAGIYKSTDGGANWFRSNCGLSNAKLGYVLYSPTDANIVLTAVQGEAASFSQAAGQLFDGGIYRSSDSGANWSLTVMPEGAADRNRYWIIRASGTPTTYVTFGFNFEDSSLNAGFLRSADEGQTWTPFASELRGKSITHFDVSSDGKVIYALEVSSFTFDRSTDGGDTWEPLSNVSPGPQGPIAICPGDSQTVLFTSFADLRLTTDGMQTDAVVQTAAAQFEWIAFAPSDPGIVYTATQGYDIYKSTDKGATFTLMANLRAVINASP
ncbi:MAG: exo-alpha-sialidase [Planctomycetes bacterium]|nr:exo-alpha-sialidase [Planctomycetota bacterium]